MYRAPTGISSAYREEVEKHVSKHLGPGYGHIIKEIGMQSKCLSDILSIHKFDKKIDILQIDTEGADLDVLKDVDFDGIIPSIIFVETKSISPEKFQGYVSC